MQAEPKKPPHPKDSHGGGLAKGLGMMLLSIPAKIWIGNEYAVTAFLGGVALLLYSYFPHWFKIEVWTTDRQAIAWMAIAPCATALVLYAARLFVPPLMSVLRLPALPDPAALSRPYSPKLVHHQAVSTVSAGRISVEQEKSQLQTSPEVQLLKRAAEVVGNCHSFQFASKKRFQDAQRQIQEHNSNPRDRSEQSKSSFMQWKMDLVGRGDMQLYQQVYRQEFMEMRRLLAVRVPDAVEPLIDYDNPYNMGGVTGICYDLSNLTEAYIKQQYTAKTISLEDGRKYLELLRPRSPLRK